MKATFSLFLHPLVTLFSQMSHASLGSREKGPPSLYADQRLLWERATCGQRGLQRTPPKIGRTKHDMWHTSSTSAQLESKEKRFIREGVWGWFLREELGGTEGKRGYHLQIIHSFGNSRWKFSQHRGTVSECLFLSWLAVVEDVSGGCEPAVSCNVGWPSAQSLRSHGVPRIRKQSGCQSI